MSPPIRVWGACRTLAIRARPTKPIQGSIALATTVSKRSLATDGGKSAGPSGSDVEAMLQAGVTGGVLKAHGLEGGLTPAQEQTLYEEGIIKPAATGSQALDQMTAIATGLSVAGEGEGHKFSLPDLPLPWDMQMKSRYHPVLTQISRLLMRDGKLSKAQSHLSRVLAILRTSPPPILSPKYPLLPGAPPPSHLPLNPIVYLTLAIDSVAPLMRIRHLRGLAGGGAALEMPMPLEVRQRRRIAFQWILETVNKKPSMGSGRNQFAHRLASEIIAVVEGRSGVWDKRQQVHKLATAARANLANKKKAKSKKG